MVALRPDKIAAGTMPYGVQMCYFFERAGKEVLLNEAISYRELSPPIRVGHKLASVRAYLETSSPLRTVIRS
jgi:hypothetical protein